MVALVGPGRYRSSVLTLSEHNFRRDPTPQVMDAHRKTARTLRKRVACGKNKKISLITISENHH
jgi:hypothetical protein